VTVGRHFLTKLHHQPLKRQTHREVHMHNDPGCVRSAELRDGVIGAEYDDGRAGAQEYTAAEVRIHARH